MASDVGGILSCLMSTVTWADIERILLSGLSRTEGDGCRRELLICGIYKKIRLKGTEGRKGAMAGGGSKLTPTRWRRPEDLMYNAVTIVDNVVLRDRNLLRG